MPYEPAAAGLRARVRQDPCERRLHRETPARQPLVLRREDPFAQVVVPDHAELDRGTLRAILRQAGLSVDEFIRLAR